jgi:hypothetical protein
MTNNNVIEPVYRTLKPNENINLGCENITLTYIRKQISTLDNRTDQIRKANLSLKFIPSPKILIQIPPSDNIRDDTNIFSSNECTISFVDRDFSCDCLPILHDENGVTLIIKNGEINFIKPNARISELPPGKPGGFCQPNKFGWSVASFPPRCSLI